MSLIYNATFDKNTRKLAFEDKAGNEIYSFTVPERVPVDDIKKPLTFKAIQDGSTVKLTKDGSPDGSFQTSRDGGNTWADYSIGTAITLNTGDEVSFRAKADRTSGQGRGNYFYFDMTGKIEAWHNVMSLYRTNDFATYKSVVDYAFYWLFRGCSTSLVKAPVLPATTLSDNCYDGIFYGCPSLTKAPELPATTLSNNCYADMFYGCQSLAEAPELPATTLANYCYYNMFRGCQSLTKAPDLPATTLANYCYGNMFNGCRSLTEAPALPATSLSAGCYGNMFNGCRSLTEAPALPANTLADSCYSSMFDGCTSLTESPVLPSTTLAGSCYQSMFDGCTSLTKSPRLPATTLASSCYASMFRRCTSLAEAHELPATTLAQSCYSSMFSGCTSLTKAPELPATTLASGCYTSMFKGCSSLNEVRCKMPSTISAKDIPNYTGNGSNSSLMPWLSNVSATGTFYTNEDANWPSGASGIPEGWTRVNEGAPTVDDVTKPLTFRATQGGSTVTLTKKGLPSGAFQTSTDGGSTWTDYTIGTAITLNTGDEVSFRAGHDRVSAPTDSNYFQFKMTGKIEAWNNVMSLSRINDFATYESVGNYEFYHLFDGCTSLTKSPRLPATTLAQDCYSFMFRGCTSLTKAPYLPATNLAQSCYHYMFGDCTSLTETPFLQATRLGNRCYSDMFSGCSSLNKVRCYIPSSYSSTDLSVHADGWLYGVASTGTFYTNADANWSSDSVRGVPEGWTRINA